MKSTQKSHNLRKIMVLLEDSEESNIIHGNVVGKRMNNFP
jgi:hypothetical protein